MRRTAAVLSDPPSHPFTNHTLFATVGFIVVMLGGRIAVQRVRAPRHHHHHHHHLRPLISRSVLRQYASPMSIMVSLLAVLIAWFLIELVTPG